MAFDQSTRNRLARFVGDTRSLLSEEFPYHIVFDGEPQNVPAWVYPKDIDFTHNRVTILAGTEGQTSK